MNKQFIHTCKKHPLNTRTFHSSSVYSVYPDQTPEIDELDTNSLNKGMVLDKLRETRKLSKEVRKDLANTSSILDRLTKIRLDELTRQDPILKSELENKEKDINSCLTEAIKKGMASRIGLDLLNEHSMKKAMFSIHKSDYVAEKVNFPRTEEEIATVDAAKGLVTDLKQLRDNFFSLDEADNRLSESNSDLHSGDKRKRSNIDDYADFEDYMPSYGVGGGDE